MNYFSMQEAITARLIYTPIGMTSEPNSWDPKLCRIAAALRHDLNSRSDFHVFLMLRNEHHGRDARLYSIAIQFPKLDVAGVTVGHPETRTPIPVVIGIARKMIRTTGSPTMKE